MAFFVAIIALDLAQIYLNFFPLLDNNDIDANSRSVRGLALSYSMIQARIFLGWQIWGLVKLAWLAIVVSIALISDKIVRNLFSLIVFLVSWFFTFYQLIVPRTICITFPYKRKSLMAYLDFDTNDFFDNLLPIFQVSILFVYLDTNKRSQAISKKPNQNVFIWGGGINQHF